MPISLTDIFRADTDESRKMEVDYSATCDEKIPLYKEMAANGKFIEAIDGLLSLEKQTRTVSSQHFIFKLVCIPFIHSYSLIYLNS